MFFYNYFSGLTSAKRCSFFLGSILLLFLLFGFCLPGLARLTKGLKIALPEQRCDGYAMLMSPNNGETAVHDCSCQGDMVVGMRKVLAIPRS